MAQTAATSPGTMANSPVGGSYFSWVNPDNAKTSDNAYVTSSADMSPIVDLKVSLIKADGTYGTQNKQIAGQWPITADTYYSYGNSSDVWGEALTAEDVNDVDFGIVLQVGQSDTQINSYSDDLEATNFGFTIPTGATINGILVEIERNYLVVGRAKAPQVDHIRITVYYTSDGSASGSASPSASESASPSASPTEYRKKYTVQGTAYGDKYSVTGNAYTDKYSANSPTYVDKYRKFDDLP